MEIRVNMDAFAFIGSAINPSDLFQKKYLRQSRPGYILIGSALGYSIYYLTYPLHSFFEKQIQRSITLKNTEAEKEKKIYYFCFYTGYVLLNFTILFYALCIFHRLIKPEQQNWQNGNLIYVMLLFSLAANAETKYFLWTPHQQLFNILTPLLSIYYGLKIINRTLHPLKIFFVSLLSGLGFLIYGNFLLLFATIMGCYLYTNIQDNIKNKKAFLCEGFKIVLSFVLPTIVWILILRLNNVTFFSAETESYRQFVWLLDAIKVSPQYFFYRYTQNTFLFFNTLGSIIFPSSVFLLIIIFSWEKIKKSMIFKDEPFVIPAIIASLYFVFFLLLGYYADRLTFSLVPFITYYSGYFLNKYKIGIPARITLIILILIQYIWIAVYDPPHFSTTEFYN